VPELD